MLFKLQAALGSGFNSSFNNAINTTKQFQSTLTKINSLTGKIEGYKKQAEAVENSRKKLSLLTEEHEKLAQEMSAVETPSEALEKKFEQNEKQIAATTAKIEEQEQRLDSLGRELKEAGVNTDDLEAANDRLSKSYDKVKKSQEQLAKIAAAQSKNAAAISTTKKQLATTVGIIGAVGTAIYAGPVQSAMQFESKMADVVKVVDGLKDGTTGELTEDYYKLKKEIIDLSTKIPMTAEQLTEITAAAGQAGIARAELGKFSSDAAKMGVAFDSTAEQAGEWMAKWRTAFGLSQTEVVTLADKINYLGNTSAANALQISEIVTKVGPLGDVAGLANGEIAALGATLVSVGVSEDVAATGIRKVMTTMTAGAAATKRQQKVLDQLGYSATDLAERMQTDAKGAILDFMAAVKKLPEAEQTAALKMYFGEESVAAIAPMLTQLGLLEENFNKVGDAAEYAGSMEAEYAARADTTENKVQLAKNSLSKLSIVLGETFLPYVGQAAEKLSELVTKLADFATENPEIVKTVVKVATGLAGLSVAGFGAKLGFLELQKGVLGVEKVFALFKGKIAEAGVSAATNSGKLATLGKNVAGYFGGVKTSLGNLGGSVDKVFGGKLGTMFSKIGSSISNGVLTPLGSIGSKIGGVMGGVGGKITGAFGKIGGAIANGPLGKIGGVFKSLGGVASSVLGPAVQGLGGMFGGLFGKIMPIIMIISALSMLFVKLSGGDISGFIEPLKQAFEQIKPVLESVMQQFAELGKQILPLLMDAAQQLAPLFGQIVTAILPVILQLIQQLVPLFIQIVQTVLPVILDLLTQLAPLFTNIITAILPVIVQLMQILLPIITQLITSVLPIVVQLLNSIVPIITQIINAILPVFLSLLQALMPVIQFVADLFSNVLGAAIQEISGIISGLMQVLQGIIDFITGVFTGNWEQAWAGIQSVFTGIWEAIKSVCFGVINGITSAINVIIGGLNTLKIPDWVPGIGGMGINIPLIPQLAKGSNFTPDTFIAGEKGAELVTNARGRKIFTAAQTGSIFGNIAQAVNALKSGIDVPELQLAYAGAAAGGVTAQTVEAPGGTSVVIHSAPVFHVGSDAQAQDIEEVLRKREEELLDKVDDRIKKKEDDERRRKYD